MAEIFSVLFYLLFFGLLGYWFCDYFGYKRGFTTAFNGVCMAIGIMLANDSLVFSLEGFIMDLLTFGIVTSVVHILSMSFEIIKIKRETKKLREEIEAIENEIDALDAEFGELLKDIDRVESETQLTKHYGEVGGNNGPN